ncbi:MAG: energy transducer TonB [Terriglobales bacterium]
MFEDRLIESSGRIKTKRGWTTVLSVVIQCLLVGILVLIPLIYTEALPKQQLVSFLVAPPPPPPPPPPAAEVIRAVKVIQTDIVDGQLRSPTKIPEKVQMITEDEPPPAMASGGVVGGVPGGIPGGQMGGVLGGIISSTPLAVPRVAPSRVRVSQGVVQGNAISQPKPLYPQMARMARVQGAVILQAVISKAGNIENLRVVSGHPMLQQSALDAVRQWRYRPYLLNGEPVEVETQITVNFNLAGG